MSNDAKFLDGMRVYTPSEKAPDFIVANFEIDGDAFVGRGKVRGVLKRSKGGKLYAVEDDFKPKDAKPPQHKPEPPQDDGFVDDSIPF